MNTEALFQEYNCVEDYEKAGLKFISPMLAKELEDVIQKLNSLGLALKKDEE